MLKTKLLISLLAGVLLLLMNTSCENDLSEELTIDEPAAVVNRNVYVFPTDDTFNNEEIGMHQFRIDLIGNKNLNKDIYVHLRAYIGNSQTVIQSPVKIPKGRLYSNPITVRSPGSYRVEVTSSTSPANPQPIWNE